MSVREICFKCGIINKEEDLVNVKISMSLKLLACKINIILNLVEDE